MPVYVIGHRNPDTDSICAALAYAHFLARTTRADAVAACCGEVNPRTQSVLDRAGVPAPRLVMDVRPTLGQVCRRDLQVAREDEAFFEVYGRMQACGRSALPVLDAAGGLAGMISLPRLLELLLPDPAGQYKPRLVETSVSRICRALSGRILHGADVERTESLYLTVGAMSSARFVPRLREYPPAQTLIVAGDRPTIHRPTLESGARCLVLTGGAELEPDLLDLARARGVCVLSSPWDTATTTLRIRGARGIGPVIDRDFLRFQEATLARTARKEVHPARQEVFPVLDRAGALVGVFSKDDLASPEPVRLVLVDHNELAQAVCGAEEAEILEVLDHHRVGGGLVSREPIRFTNDPVGATCTLVARCFRREGVPVPPGIGQCLAAGIISDTLNLSSPTTTPADRDLLQWLGGACGFDPDAFAEDFFAAGSVLKLRPPAEALRMDCKDYTEGPWRLAVAQIEEVGFEHFRRHREALAQALAGLIEEKRLDFACLLVTDISTNNSLLLAGGDPRVVEAVGYPRLEPGLFQLDTVVSRKKQLLPHLSRVLERLDKDPGA